MLSVIACLLALFVPEVAMAQARPVTQMLRVCRAEQATLGAIIRYNKYSGDMAGINIGVTMLSVVTSTGENLRLVYGSPGFFEKGQLIQASYKKQDAVDITDIIDPDVYPTVPRYKQSIKQVDGLLTIAIVADTFFTSKGGKLVPFEIKGRCK